MKRRFARRLLALACGLALAACAAGARADISVDGTRFVYPAREKSITLRAGNPGSAPILVQMWIDQGQGQDDLAKLSMPFALVPPLFRLDPGERKAVQLRYTGEPLPQDRESLFWINFVEVPSTGAKGEGLRVQIGLSMKLLFRPPGLAGGPRDAPGKLRWAYRSEGAATQLEAENPTPYNVTLRALKPRGAQGPGLESIAVPPYATARFAWSGPLPRGAADITLDYLAVDDFGLTSPGVARAVARPGP